MKKEELVRYFESIKEKTDGDNTSNSEIIDYENGNSISLDEIEEEYYKYLDLQEEVGEYTEENYLDNVSDKEEIKKHFKNKINEDLFKFNQAVLVDFVEYMTAKIKKQNKNQRKANMLFNKTGNRADTTRITIPVTWAKKLGFTSEEREAIIKLEGDEIIIRKKI